MFKPSGGRSNGTTNKVFGGYHKCFGQDWHTGWEGGKKYSNNIGEYQRGANEGGSGCYRSKTTRKK